MKNNSNSQMQEVGNRLNPASGGFAYSALVLVYVAVSLIGSLILSFSGLEKGSTGYLYFNYLLSPLIIAICVTATLFIRKINFKSVFPVKCHPKYYLIGIMLVFGLLFSLGWVNDVTVEFFKLFGYKQRDPATYLPDLSGGLIVPALLVIAVLPAFCEELIFRGVILNCCKDGMGTLRTVFVIGFCFSLYHASPEQTVYQFIAGCAFAFLAIRSGSILPSIMMHFINNALIIILQACGQLDVAGKIVMPEAVNIALIVISALSLIGGIVWLVLDKKPFIKCSKGGVKLFFLFASFGIAVLGIVWICALFGLA